MFINALKPERKNAFKVELINISFDSFYRAVEKLCKSAVLNRDAEIQEVIWYNAKNGRALKNPDLMNEVEKWREEANSPYPMPQQIAPTSYSGYC